MSYLQALNAGLLDSADNQTLQTILDKGNTTTTSIILSGSSELDFNGDGYISASSTQGLNIHADGDASLINLKGLTYLTTNPLAFSYSALPFPVGSLTRVGGTASYSYVPSSPIALTNDSTWRVLNNDTANTPVAGVYMCSFTVIYTNSSTFALGNVVYFGNSNISTTTPAEGCYCGSSVNVGVCSFTVPFVSDGLGINDHLKFVYKTSMAGVTVTSIGYTLVRIG